MEWTHGGDWMGYYKIHGVMPLDFSANVSPLGLPKGVKEAVAGAMEYVDSYPDPFSRELRSVISRVSGIPAEWVLCSAGAGDLIQRVVLAVRPGKALVTAPSFSEYSRVLKEAGAEVEAVPLLREDAFQITDAFLEQITPEVDLVFLCEPNNPTGQLTERALLDQILECCIRCGTLLVVDECFNAFLDHSEEHSLISRLKETDSLLILNAFTKQYGLAGLRLGYALCRNQELLERMFRCGSPWPVSNVAQAAGIAALLDTEYFLRLKKLMAEQRPLLRAGLASCGAREISGEANYLFFFHTDSALDQKLWKKGILIRNCENYDGLSAGWYRVAVRTAEENQRLIQSMRQVI